jgi:hypothetical protein
MSGWLATEMVDAFGTISNNHIYYRDFAIKFVQKVENQRGQIPISDQSSFGN